MGVNERVSGHVSGRVNGRVNGELRGACRVRACEWGSCEAVNFGALQLVHVGGLAHAEVLDRAQHLEDEPRRKLVGAREHLRDGKGMANPERVRGCMAARAWPIPSG